MAKCIKDIIDNNVASGGIGNASSASSTTAYPSGYGTYINAPISSNGDIKYADNFVDALSSATMKLRNTDCTQTVLDFFSNQFPAASSMAKKSYDWVSDNANLQSGMSALGNKLKGGSLEKMTDQFCDTVTTLSRTLIFYLDTATKAAFVLFKKIDALKRKIEKALLEFTDAVRNCIVSVIVDAKNAINRVVRKVLDFDIVLDLMRHCPCITKIIASLFNCKRDSDGNKLTTPEEVLNCVLEKYTLDPTQIINAINNFIDNTILSTINKGFNMLDEFIKTTMELLMAPFRALIRLYAKLLNTKINMTFIIRGLGPAECLLIYTKEHTKSGGSYLGMSIIDMVNTLKSWANCFEFACQSFTEDMATKIKELNENLRLDDKYWRDVMSIDLYQSAIGAKVQSNQPRPAMIREIFTKNQGKGKNVFIGIIDSFKQVGKITIDTGLSDKTLGETAEAVKFKDGPDNESANTNNGIKTLNSTVENNLMSMELNLASDTSSFYVEKLLQLVDWEGTFKKSGAHNTQIDKLIATQQTLTPDYSTIQISTAYVSNNDRVYYAGDATETISDVKPTYEITDDYNSTSINKINNYETPVRNESESLTDYYRRWYNGAIA